MLSTHKSRPIKVRDCNYRWAISPGNGYVVFVAESADDPASKIEVYVETEINQMWLEFPHNDGQNLKVVTPKDAASIISQAIDKGWNPTEKGKPLVFDYLKDGNLAARRT